jgi:serine/threonine protein kinase
MPPSAAPDPTRNVPVRPGDVLAEKYELERVIGAGGVGVVFAARHLGLDQRVAIKLLQRSALGSEENVSRFEREVKVLARIRSEHVARVMDNGQLPTGEPFMVLEHLEGEDLGAVIKSRGALPIEEAALIMVQVCEGVALAHGLGVVHRDLKPANLFLTRGPDGRPVAKVLDFGISKLQRPGQDDPAFTRTLSVIGSPLYMSPEQIEAPRDADERSDVWSLGVIFYELVTGKAPFDASTLPLLCASICTAEPTPMSVHLPEAPPALWRVIQRCLEKDRSRRFASVAELALALAPFGGAASRPSAERAQRIAETHGIAVGMQDEQTPESVGRRMSWSSVPPKPRRRRRQVLAMSALAVLAAAIVWLAHARNEAASQRAAAGFGGVLVQARLAAELAAASTVPSAAPQPAPLPVAEVTVASASAPPVRTPPSPKQRPRPAGTARKRGGDLDVLSER